MRLHWTRQLDQQPKPPAPEAPHKPETHNLGLSICPESSPRKLIDHFGSEKPEKSPRDQQPTPDTPKTIQLAFLAFSQPYRAIGCKGIEFLTDISTPEHRYKATRADFDALPDKPGDRAEKPTSKEKDR